MGPSWQHLSLSAEEEDYLSVLFNGTKEVKGFILQRNKRLCKVGEAAWRRVG